ncbi:hypothetical protein [Taibaiella koreensis]|uniref:hypothetical protein n=1 Tax=Taibaiella koreensis TaxID=1268548 RepID=UPI000E599D33|nr:hypothetical protein [Taibaiella koreensis]
MENGKVIKSATYKLEQDNNKITQALLYEQGDVGGEILFVLSCQHIPVGSEISFECPELGPQPPIQLQPTVVTSDDFSAGMRSYVPAHFVGTIYYSVMLKGTPPPGAQMEMRAMYVAPMDVEQA